MKFPPSCLFLAFSLAASAVAAELPVLKVRPQTIDAKISVGYGLAIADVDGDGQPDILLADAKQIVWYRAPKWEKFVMAENLTPKDNVCIAARDLDGDGKCEVAVGAEWAPNDTVNSGAIFLLNAPADRTQRWTAVKLPHEPTTHRMHWLRGADGKFFLAVLPLHGRGNKNNEGVGAAFLGYAWPWRETSRPFPLFGPDAALHATHNFDVIPGRAESVLVAAKEGVRSIYRGSASADLTSSRLVLDESLNQGHGLATGDLLGLGSDQIVVGSRGAGKPGDKFGLKLYAPGVAPDTTWKLATVIDDNQMACEDLKIADLNGDGRPDIIAAGRATKNVIIYWNETSPPKP